MQRAVCASYEKRKGTIGTLVSPLAISQFKAVPVDYSRLLKTLRAGFNTTCIASTHTRTRQYHKQPERRLFHVKHPVSAEHPLFHVKQRVFSRLAESVLHPPEKK